MKIFTVNINEHSGFRCLDSDSLILWDDENIVDAIEDSCVLAVVSSLCPENCAVGGLPLSKEWETHYARNAADSCLEEMILSAEMDAVALQVIRSGIACGPSQETTYFLIPSDLSHTKLCTVNEEA